MKSMSDEIVSLETVKAVEDSLRNYVNEQSSRITELTTTVRRVRTFAISLAVSEIVIALAFVLHLLTH